MGGVRTRSTVLAVLLPAVLLLGGCLQKVEPAAQADAPPPPGPTEDRAGRAQTNTRAGITYPTTGAGTWQLARRGPLVGRAGKLLRFHVAVENGITGVGADEFGQAVVKTLGDPRSWTADGKWRFQLAGPGEQSDFTIYLATPGTRDRLCADGPDKYTSCRKNSNVVLNVARWVNGVPRYGADLGVYRQYMVNHETGHQLGHNHELCPGAGKPAPVMQTQTLDLKGCTANAWPYLDGKRYFGAPAPR